MKNFLHVNDVIDLNQVVDAALDFKANPFKAQSTGTNKTMVLMFMNPSLRTRLSTQKAAINLGMNCIVMNAGQDGWKLEFEDGAVMKGDKAEHIREAAAVISQYADVIGIRTFAGLQDRSADYNEEILSRFVEHTSVPVVNLESATVHPLQSLTDLMTIREFSKVERPRVVLSWAPHPRALPQAVSNSFVEWMRTANMDLIITNPTGFDLSPDFVKDTRILHNQQEAFEGADIIYAKNWSSYEDYGKINSNNDDWMITADKMDLTNSARFMHCLPVRRNVVVADEVIDHIDSLVINQAANREWAAQAVLHEILKSL